jgi:hypothetical protein
MLETSVRMQTWLSHATASERLTIRKVSTELVKKEVEVLHHTTSEYASRQSAGCLCGLKSSQCSSEPARRLAMKSSSRAGSCTTMKCWDLQRKVHMILVVVRHFQHRRPCNNRCMMTDNTKNSVTY